VVKVEALIGQTITGVVDNEVSRWLAGLDAVMYKRLVKVGLATPRVPVAAAQTLLGEFLDTYIAGRTDAKSRTILNLKMFRDRLTAFFGRDRDLISIKHSDADAWLIHLKANYAAATVGRTIKGARQFFKAACRAKIVDRNPFEDLKAGSNRTRNGNGSSLWRTHSSSWTPAPMPNGACSLPCPASAGCAARPNTCH
jgi:hypothetical protein